MMSYRSVTSPVLPPCPPPLLPLGAVKYRLPQFDIDIVVSVAQPFPKFSATARSYGVFSYVILEVFGAYPARVEPREELDKTNDVVLLRFAGRSGVCGCYRVQERPRIAPESFNICRAVFRWRRTGGGQSCCR